MAKTSLPNVTRLTKTKLYDLIGSKIHRLTILSAEVCQGASKWHCLCDCGTLYTLHATQLFRGRVKSCGCMSLAGAIARTTHGDTKGGPSPEYRVYRGAKSRCVNPKNKNYDRYGGRGVEFRFADFEHFLRVLGRRPSAQHSIERTDNDGHYEPNNVKWATLREQSLNKSNTRFFTVNGITKTLVDLCEESGISRKTVMTRLRHGWCENCAFTMQSLPGRNQSNPGCPHRYPEPYTAPQPVADEKEQ